MGAQEKSVSQSVKVVVLTRPRSLRSLESRAVSGSNPSTLELALQEQGYKIQHVPLIDIQGPPEPQIIEQLSAQLHQFQAIMFVSPQAVMHFFEHLRMDMSRWTTPCWVTGGGSEAALLRAGVKAELIFKPEDDSGLWDSEHLWLRVEGLVNAAQRVLIVRGRDDAKASSGAVDVDQDLRDGVVQSMDAGVGREYLSQKLQDKGIEVRYLVAYQRSSPTWTQEECSRVRDLLGPGKVWLFTSSQAAKNLAQLLKPFDFSNALAIATHERIAKELRHLGFGVVLLSLPGAKDLMRSLESLP